MTRKDTKCSKQVKVLHSSQTQVFNLKSYFFIQLPIIKHIFHVYEHTWLNIGISLPFFSRKQNAVVCISFYFIFFCQTPPSLMHRAHFDLIHPNLISLIRLNLGEMQHLLLLSLPSLLGFWDYMSDLCFHHPPGTSWDFGDAEYSVCFCNLEEKIFGTTMWIFRVLLLPLCFTVKCLLIETQRNVRV